MRRIKRDKRSATMQCNKTKIWDQIKISKALKIKVGFIQYKELQQFMKYKSIQC